MGLASVSTLRTTARPAMSRASAATSGAAILHGPHHAAQKSTKTGTRAPFTIAVKPAALASNGEPSGGSARLHEPHRPLSARCLIGTRLLALQEGHVRRIE
jgi:hypothetical protein